MNSRNLVILIVVVTVAMTISFVSLFYVKTYHPTLLGLAPNPEDTLFVAEPDSIELAETYEISKEKLESLQQQIKNKEAIKKQKDSLAKLIAKLKKLDKENQNEIKKLQDSLIPLKDRKLNNSQTFSQLLKDSIQKLIASKEQVEKKAKAFEDKFNKQKEVLTEKVDTNLQMNYQEFAKIYNNSTPTEVAKILEKMDEKDAAAILKRMQKRKAGKVIDAMDPQKAAMILLLAGDE